MRWIDFENKKPTDTDISGWIPWTKELWDAWQKESERLLGELTALNAVGKIEERNKLIDSNKAHWGKLKPWLSALSKGKCWFTEARDIASHPDVEHFRPKKIAKNLDGSERDGYWWLAFDYTNYRFACNVPNRMKGGWFPLHEDSVRSEFNAQCEESEDPYLLDPVKKTDVDLLAFNEEGNAIPLPGITDLWEQARVKKTIERLKLNEHDALPSARRKIWQEATRAIESFLKAKRAYIPGRNIAPKVTMEECARKLYQLIQSDAELSTVALWCIRFRNDPSLLKFTS